MRTHATSRMWEKSLQNCQILENLLENIEIFLLLKSNFPHTKFDFLKQFSAFFNGFPLSSMAFQFSSMAFRFSSMAFLFPINPRKSIHGGKYTKDHHSSFVFPATCSPSFVIATCSPSFVIATRSPSFVIATMPTSHPTMKLILSANELNFTIHWYIDESHQVHEDCRGKIGCLMTMEKERHLIPLIR
jgi:hypothetical protein